MNHTLNMKIWFDVDQFSRSVHGPGRVKTPAEEKNITLQFKGRCMSGFIEGENRVEPASNPFTPKVLPMSSV